MIERDYVAWRDARISELLESKNFNVYDLCDIVTILRGEGGCPWDREQDHHSIRKGLIEECYEVVEAIDRDDAVLMREELGDLLLQIIFHADIEREGGQFDIDDVAHDECIKMIHRHPHVFGNGRADTSEEVLKNWEIIKTEEKQRASLADQLYAIPPMLPALMRAQKVGKKAGAYSDVSVRELSNEIAATLDELQSADSKEAKRVVGHALFQLTALCRLLNVEAEEALSAETEDFIGRVVRKQ